MRFHCSEDHKKVRKPLKQLDETSNGSSKTRTELGEKSRQRNSNIHGFLEVLPFTACIIASCLHWDALRSLVGRGRSPPEFHVRMKECNIPDGALAMTGAMLLGVACSTATNTAAGARAPSRITTPAAIYRNAEPRLCSTTSAACPAHT